MYIPSTHYLHNIYTTSTLSTQYLRVQLRQQPVSLKHRLDIMLAPEVVLGTEQETVTVKEGSSAKLECSATGFPKPKGRQ